MTQVPAEQSPVSSQEPVAIPNIDPHKQAIQTMFDQWNKPFGDVYNAVTAPDKKKSLESDLQLNFLTNWEYLPDMTVDDLLTEWNEVIPAGHTITDEQRESLQWMLDQGREAYIRKHPTANLAVESGTASNNVSNSTPATRGSKAGAVVEDRGTNTIEDENDPGDDLAIDRLLNLLVDSSSETRLGELHIMTDDEVNQRIELTQRMENSGWLDRVKEKDQGQRIRNARVQIHTEIRAIRNRLGDLEKNREMTGIVQQINNELTLNADLLTELANRTTADIDCGVRIAARTMVKLAHPDAMDKRDRLKAYRRTRNQVQERLGTSGSVEVSHQELSDLLDQPVLSGDEKDALDVITNLTRGYARSDRIRKQQQKRYDITSDQLKKFREKVADRIKDYPELLRLRDTVTHLQTIEAALDIYQEGYANQVEANTHLIEDLERNIAEEEVTHSRRRAEYDDLNRLLKDKSQLNDADNRRLGDLSLEIMLSEQRLSQLNEQNTTAQTAVQIGEDPRNITRMPLGSDIHPETLASFLGIIQALDGEPLSSENIEQLEEERKSLFRVAGVLLGSDNVLDHTELYEIFAESPIPTDEVAHDLTPAEAHPALPAIPLETGTEDISSLTIDELKARVHTLSSEQVAALTMDKLSDLASLLSTEQVKELVTDVAPDFLNTLLGLPPHARNTDQIVSAGVSHRESVIDSVIGGLTQESRNFLQKATIIRITQVASAIRARDSSRPVEDVADTKEKYLFEGLHLIMRKSIELPLPLS